MDPMGTPEDSADLAGLLSGLNFHCIRTRIGVACCCTGPVGGVQISGSRVCPCVCDMSSYCTVNSRCLLLPGDLLPDQAPTTKRRANKSDGGCLSQGDESFSPSAGRPARSGFCGSCCAMATRTVPPWLPEGTAIAQRNPPFTDCRVSGTCRVNKFLTTIWRLPPIRSRQYSHSQLSGQPPQDS